MTGEEIRDKINFNNQQIEKLLDPSTFVLNHEIQHLMEENDKLRAKCNHNFKNGQCIYCGTKE